jgi:RNA polymerase sigma-70 factor, ECF subfamily
MNFETVYLEHQGWIYNNLRMKLANCEDAKDLTEEAFLKAFTAWDTYEDRGFNIRSWIYKIACNLVNDFYRKRNFIEEEEVTEESWVDETDLDMNMVEEFETERVRQLLGYLTPLQKEVIQYRFYEGLDHETIARKLNRSNEAIRIIQCRAVKCLRRRWG